MVEVVAQLREFAFLRLRSEEGGIPRYKLHNLVQEATRYGLSAKSSDDGVEDEAYFSNVALQITATLFPERKRETWA